MLSYTPPLKHMRYVLEDVLDAPKILHEDAGFAEMDADLMRQLIEEAGRFASEVLFPLNATGDREGCSYRNGEVETPHGFAAAYRQFCEAGWPALACAPEYGGQDLPHLIDCVLYETLVSANQAWTMYPALLHGAYTCLKKHGSEELKARYLRQIVSGEWLATMCLTEPQAGSDLGLLRTRAVSADDGSYRISGQKIFISGGAHDLTGNIVHLVLARLPDAPPGSRGISLFLVPKLLPDGSRNAVRCTGIEHKMGIHGSATCSMAFEGATGWIIGQSHRGLASMFAMMNAARLHVGAQGLGIAEAAYQNSLAYAQERLQMKAVLRPSERGDAPADPIALHPPVQRLLGTQQVYVEGGRMLLYWSALLLDLAERHCDPVVRTESDALLAFLTPVVKSFLTQQGFEGASQALQVYGGYGFICETGIEQFLRDARITMIYEGTNEIQAVDLLVRKIVADGGACLGRFLAMVETTAQQMQQDRPENVARHASKLMQLCADLRRVGEVITEQAPRRPDLPHWIAADMLRLIGHCALGWLWLRSTYASLERMADDETFHCNRLKAADYYFRFVFAETKAALGIVDECIVA